MSSRQPWAAQLPDWLAFVGALTQLQLLLSGVLAIVVLTTGSCLLPTLRQRAFAATRGEEEEDEANVRLLQSTVPVFVLTPVEVMELVLRDEPEVEDEVDYTEESRLKMKQLTAQIAEANQVLSHSRRVSASGTSAVVLMPYVVLTVGSRTMKTRVAQMFKADVLDTEFSRAKFCVGEAFHVPTEPDGGAGTQHVLYAQVFHHDLHASEADLRLAFGFYDLRPLLKQSADTGDAATVGGAATEVAVELHGPFRGTLRLLVERRTVGAHPSIDNQCVLVNDQRQWPSHGGFVGVAVSFVQSPRWMLILRQLMPKTHALVVDSLHLPHRVLLLLQHNPVLSAYGLVVSGGTQQMESSLGGPPLYQSAALELPVLLDEFSPGRLDLAMVGHGTRTQTMFLAAFKRPMVLDKEMRQFLTEPDYALSVAMWLEHFCAAINVACRGARYRPLLPHLRPDEVGEMARRRAHMVTLPSDLAQAYTVTVTDAEGRSAQRAPRGNVARLIGASLAAQGALAKDARRFLKKEQNLEMDFSDKAPEKQSLSRGDTRKAQAKPPPLSLGRRARMSVERLARSTASLKSDSPEHSFKKAVAAREAERGGGRSRVGEVDRVGGRALPEPPERSDKALAAAPAQETPHVPESGLFGRGATWLNGLGVGLGITAAPTPAAAPAVEEEEEEAALADIEMKEAETNPRSLFHLRAGLTRVRKLGGKSSHALVANANALGFKVREAALNGRITKKLQDLLDAEAEEAAEAAKASLEKWEVPLPDAWLQHVERSELATFLLSDAATQTAASVLSRAHSLAGGIHIELRPLRQYTLSAGLFSSSNAETTAIQAAGGFGAHSSSSLMGDEKEALGGRSPADDLSRAASEVLINVEGIRRGNKTLDGKLGPANKTDEGLLAILGGMGGGGARATHALVSTGDELPMRLRDVHAFLEALGKSKVHANSVALPADELLSLIPAMRIHFFARVEALEVALRKRRVETGAVVVLDVLALMVEQGQAGGRLTKLYARDAKAIEQVRVLQRTYFVSFALYNQQMPLSAQGWETVVDIIERQPLLFPLGLLHRLHLPGAIARGEPLPTSQFDEPAASWVVPEALVAEEAKAVRMLTDHVKSEIDAGHHTQKETANATIVVWAHKLLNGRCKRSDQEYVLTLMRDEPSDEHENIAPVKQNVPTAFLNLKDRLTAAAAATAKARALQRRQRPASRRGQRACQMARAFGFKYLFFKMSGVAATELCRLLRDAGFFSQLELRTRIELVEWLVRLATSPGTQEGIACIFESSAPEECAEVAELVGMRLLHFSIGGTYWERLKASFANSFLNPNSIYGARAHSADPLLLYRHFKLQVTGMYETTGVTKEKRKLKRKDEVDEATPWREVIAMIDTADVLLWSEAGAASLKPVRAGRARGVLSSAGGQALSAEALARARSGARLAVYTHCGLVIRLRSGVRSLDELLSKAADAEDSLTDPPEVGDSEVGDDELQQQGAGAGAGGGTGAQGAQASTDTILVVSGRYSWAADGSGSVVRSTVVRSLPTFLNDSEVTDIAIRHLIGEGDDETNGADWYAALVASQPNLLPREDVALHCGGEVNAEMLPTDAMLSMRLCAELVAELFQRFGLLEAVTEAGPVPPLALSDVTSLAASGLVDGLLVGAAWLGPPRRIARTPPTRLEGAADPMDQNGIGKALVDANLGRPARKAFAEAPKLGTPISLIALQPSLCTGDLIFFHAGAHGPCRALQMVMHTPYCHVALVVSTGVRRQLLLEADPAAFSPNRKEPATKPMRLVDLEHRAIDWLRAHPANTVAVRRLRGSLRNRMLREGAPILFRLHDQTDTLPPSPVASGALSFLSSLFSAGFVAGVQLGAITANACPLHSAEVVAHGLGALGLLLADSPIPRASCRIRDLVGDGPTASLPLLKSVRWRAPVALREGK